MDSKKNVLGALAALPAAGLAFIAGQIYYAGHRKDLPSHKNQDPTATFGHPGAIKLRVVALGDSSITCPGVENLDHCFVRRIAIHLSDRFFVDLRSVAVGGSKARDVLDEQLEPAIALEPDLAIVSVGSNDAIRGTPVGRYEAELYTIVDTLHIHAKAVAVMGVGDLGTIPRLPSSLRPILTWRARAIDNAVSRVVEQFERVARSDNWGRMSVAFGSRDPALWAPDRFHASNLGHAAFAEESIPAVEEVLPFVWDGSRTPPAR